VTSLDRIK